METARASRIFGIVISALFLGSTAAPAADNYPAKPGRLILPFGAGGSTDIIGRIFAQHFSEAWGQTLVVDNRAGAAGIVGSELGARAAPDGYTIMTFGINQSITPALYKKIPYEPLRDFVPVSLYATMPNILCVTPSLPATSVSAFVKLAKANPGKLNIGTINPGSTQNLAAELFKSVTGIQVQIVPFRTSADMATALLRGDIDVMFEFFTAAHGLLSDKKVVALAST
ncbi:MAG: Bug family tripartite tricarboxylate transporter substrate binding protein, partial [Terriglobia bacterium]